MHFSYTVNGNTTYASPAASAVICLIILAIFVLMVASLWKIFKKCGEKPWRCLIPIYNTYILYKIVWGEGWLMLLNFVPFLNLVVMIITQLKLAKAFGHETGFGIGLIFLSVIFMPLLAFSDSCYLGPRPVFRDQAGALHFV